MIVPMRANQCGIQPQSRLAAPSVHYFILICFILFYFICMDLMPEAWMQGMPGVLAHIRLAATHPARP